MEETVKQKIIHQVTTFIKDLYVYPDIAEVLADKLLDNFQKGDYKEISNASDFAFSITKDLQHLSKDKHLELLTSPTLIASLKNKDLGDDLHFAHSIVDAKMLELNTGYLRLDGFDDTEENPKAVEAITEAMKIFSKARAIIFDLRENTGGSPRMVQLISSYLFDEKPVHLNSLYFRATNSTTEFWTLPDIKGERYPNKYVLILTSHKTFSAAEEFAYNLQCLKRAVIIGEVTGGGAHPGDFHLIEDQFALFVPSGRAINPITKTNWEGVGVKPDIEAPASDALETALDCLYTW
jgi:retinol-binding protein 3